MAADSAGPLNVTVSYGDDIVCTITNTRETGKLEVVKDLNPSTDSGTFNLQIDGTTEKANAGDGGSTGEKTLNTGTAHRGRDRRQRRRAGRLPEVDRVQGQQRHRLGRSPRSAPTRPAR